MRHRMRISFLGLLQCCTSIKIAELPKWVQIPPKVTKQGKPSQIESATPFFAHAWVNFYMIVEIIFLNSNIEPAHINLDVNSLCMRSSLRTFPHLTVFVLNYTQVKPIKLKDFRFVLSSIKSVLNIFDFKMVQ